MPLNSFTGNQPTQPLATAPSMDPTAAYSNSASQGDPTSQALSLSLNGQQPALLNDQANYNLAHALATNQPQMGADAYNAFQNNFNLQYNQGANGGPSDYGIQQGENAANWANQQGQQALYNGPQGIFAQKQGGLNLSEQQAMANLVSSGATTGTLGTQGYGQRMNWMNQGNQLSQEGLNTAQNQNSLAWQLANAQHGFSNQSMANQYQESMNNAVPQAENAALGAYQQGMGAQDSQFSPLASALGTNYAAISPWSPINSTLSPAAPGTNFGG